MPGRIGEWLDEAGERYDTTEAVEITRRRIAEENERFETMRSAAFRRLVDEAVRASHHLRFSTPWMSRFYDVEASELRPIVVALDTVEAKTDLEDGFEYE